MPANFKDLFSQHDVKIMALLGDDVTVTPAGGVTPVVVRSVVRHEVEDEDLLDRFDVDLHTLEILDEDQHLFNHGTLVSFEGFTYEYLTDFPKGVGRVLIIMSEVF